MFNTEEYSSYHDTTHTANMDGSITIKQWCKYLSYQGTSPSADGLLRTLRRMGFVNGSDVLFEEQFVEYGWFINKDIIIEGTTHKVGFITLKGIAEAMKSVQFELNRDPI